MAFKFEWVKKNDGFDPNPATPWLMVPSDGYKEVALPGLKNSLTNFTWTCSGDIGWAPSGGDKLFVFGNKKTGLFRLEARNAAGEVAKLDVSVKKRWTYVIQAFVLHHAGGHVSKRTFGSVGRLVCEANDSSGAANQSVFLARTRSAGASHERELWCGDHKQGAYIGSHRGRSGLLGPRSNTPGPDQGTNASRPLV